MHAQNIGCGLQPSLLPYVSLRASYSQNEHIMWHKHHCRVRCSQIFTEVPFVAVIQLQDGSSNWLKGAMLVLTYLFIAAGFWVHKDPSLTDEAR